MRMFKVGDKVMFVHASPLSFGARGAYEQAFRTGTVCEVNCVSEPMIHCWNLTPSQQDYSINLSINGVNQNWFVGSKDLMFADKKLQPKRLKSWILERKKVTA